jgi:hypothetical protein
MMSKAEDLAVITGAGRSRIGRHLHADPWRLTADAALAAIADAGLAPSDIDGVSTYPGAYWSTPGITGAGVDDVRSLLGLDLRWYTGGGQLSAGRLHGYGGLLEACVQLRGEGGRRQLARNPEVAVVSSGAVNFTACLLLTR